MNTAPMPLPRMPLDRPATIATTAGGVGMTATVDAALAAATVLAPTMPAPRPSCGCPDHYEQWHAAEERRTWRELDAARRAAQQLRDNPLPPVRRTP